MTGHTLPDHDLTKLMAFNTPCIISIIGAGGKTSLMFSLAGQLVKSGKKVLCTTTTKIFYPGTGQCPKTFIHHSTDELLRQIMEAQDEIRPAAAGKIHDPATNKVTGFDPPEIDRIIRSKIFDIIIVEADGARRKPLKASNSTEPVIPQTTTHMILVAGLDAIGSVLDDTHVHRAELFSRNTGLEKGGIVTSEHMAKGLAVEAQKATALCAKAMLCVFLNKADSKEHCELGFQVIKLIRKSFGPVSGIIGCLEPEPCFTKAHQTY